MNIYIGKLCGILKKQSQCLQPEDTETEAGSAGARRPLKMNTKVLEWPIAKLCVSRI